MSDEFDLEDALQRFPLPEGQADAVVNRGQCATALGVSENIVSKYLDQGMPVKSKGSNGQAYEFQLSEVYAWKMARDDASQRERQAADAAATQMSLLFRNDPDADANDEFMTAEQIKRESDALYAYAKAQEQRQELVRARGVRIMFEEMLVDVRRQFLSAVDYAEMEFQLSPAQANKFQERVDNTLIQMRMRFTETCPKEVVHLKPHQPVSGRLPDPDTQSLD